MNSHSFSKPLITIGLLVLMGAVGAQTYYTHELVNRVVANQAGALSVTESAPAPETEHWDSWSAMHAEMLRMQARMEQMFIRDA